jgi:hypothetical protein
VPPSAGIVDLGVVQVEAFVKLVDAAGLVRDPRHRLNRDAATTDRRPAAQAIGVDLDVLALRHCARSPASPPEPTGDARQVLGFDLLLPDTIADVLSRLILERQNIAAIGRQMGRLQRPSVAMSYS